ncbi:MAG: hypothetical protein ACKVPX_13230 [Myxococcaceae bacterium]
MTPRTLDKLVVQLARRQHGVIHMTQVTQLGATPSQVRHRLRRGDWEWMLPGVMRMGWAAQDATVRAMAATLWAGPNAATSHVSAAALWGLLKPKDAEVHITTQRHLRRPAPWIVLHQGRLGRSMQRMRSGVPLTSPSRTLFDLSGDPGLDLQSLLEDAVRRGLTSQGELVSLLRVLPSQGKAGIVRLREVLSQEPPEAFRTQSALEQWALRAFTRAGLPRPQLQHVVPIPARGVAVLDFAWPDQRVAVEADGYRFHSGRRAWESDVARHNALVSAGWRPIRVTWRALRDEQPQILAQLRDLLGSVAHSGR